MTVHMPVSQPLAAPLRTRPCAAGARLDALAAYRHVAGCDTCRDYAAAAPARFAVPTVVSATLAHHDAGHRGDTLSTATQHFALDD